MAKQRKSKNRGPGRPPINPPDMSVRKTIRMTEEQERVWLELAKSDKRNFSDWARLKLEEVAPTDTP